MGTTVSVKKVKFRLLNNADIEGVLVKDKQKDTLLYAGALKVRITDWFIFKDKAELKYMGLENALVNLTRTDSVWNYQFIIDHFSSPKKATTTINKTTTKKEDKFELNLKKIDLKNIRFINNDKWIGEKMETYIGSLVVDADKVDFKKGKIILNEVTIDKPIFSLDNFTPNRPDSLKRKKKLVDTGLQLNPADLWVQVAKLKMMNGTFINNGNQKKPLSFFDGAHINLADINGSFENITLLKDTIKAKIDLSAKERSGLQINKLIANYKVTPAIMEFDSLNLQTNKSNLQRYFAMKYKNFNDDFSDFISKVTMVANINNSTVHSDDIAFFAPELKRMKKVINVSGNFLGTVDDFSIYNLFAKNGNSSIAGKLSMKGLPDIDKTYISLQQGTVQTNAKDLIYFVPELKKFNNPNIPALGNLIFRGNFNGLYNNFITTGNLSTSLGSAYTNLNLKFPANGEPVYIGSLNTKKFNLGKFINNNKVGNIAFEGKVDGTSFTLEKMKAKFDGTIKQLEFNDYNYQNITTHGTFAKKQFSGDVKVNDPNLDFVSSVQLDFTKEQPVFNLFADIVKSNYKSLKLTKDDLQITGTVDLNFTGTNIDNFIGTAKLLNAVVKNNDTEIKFDSLAIASKYENSKKKLTLSGNDFYAELLGDFTILELPASFQSFLHNYYPAYVAEPTNVPKNQNFAFHVTTANAEPYLKLLDKNLGGLNDANIVGTLNTEEKKLNVVINVPNFSYKKYAFSGIDLTANGTLDSLNLLGEIASTRLNDSTYLPFTKLNINSANDHSLVNIQTRANNTLNDASLVAEVFTLEDGVRVSFQPSSFVINDKKWNIEKNGEFVYRSNYLSTKNLKFTQGFQEIIVDSDNDDDNNATNVNIKLKNIVVGDFIGYALTDPKLEGVATGKVELKDIFHNFIAKADLNVEQLRVDEDSIGIAKIIGGYNDKTGKINWNIISPNEKYNFTAKGTYDTKDTTKNSLLNTDIVLQNTRLTLVQKYLKGIFSNLDGYATGKLNISGKGKSINLLGDVVVKNAGVLVDYTQVYYTIDSTLIKFEDDGINFGTLTIKDKFNNTGIVKGKLYEKTFKNMFFDFDVATKKMLLIDTKAKDNERFYGKAIGKATLSFKGPETNCKMTITGEPTDSSQIYIPIVDSKESADADFIVFKQIGEEMDISKKESGFNLSVDLDLVANEKVDIDVILDDLTGDVLKAKGNGRLRIKAGTNENLDMRGRYTIKNGKYDFNFQSLVKKPFYFNEEDENYIEWTGNPMDANIHINAQYIAENVNLSELTSNTGISSSVSSNIRDNVYVIAELRDKLAKPSIKFKIDFPNNSVAKTDANFAQFLRRIESDENEMLTQATTLIVFGSFKPYGQGLATGGGINYSSLLYNTISQKVAEQATKIFSNILYQIFKDKDLKLDIGASFYSSGNIVTGSVANGSNRLDRSRFNFKIGHSFLNNNVVVTFGGDLDFGLGAANAQGGNFQWLPDLNVEIVLSKDKKLRAIVFNKNSLDISGAAFGKRNRQGISISYKQEFESIFGKKEEEFMIPAIVPDKQNLPTTPPDSINVRKG